VAESNEPAVRNGTNYSLSAKS